MNKEFQGIWIILFWPDEYDYYDVTVAKRKDGKAMIFHSEIEAYEWGHDNIKIHWKIIKID